MIKRGINSGKQLSRSSFRNSGRYAGIGTPYDDYSDESYGGYHDVKCLNVRFPHDGEDNLNGEVIIVQKGKNVEE